MTSTIPSVHKTDAVCACCIFQASRITGTQQKCGQVFAVPNLFPLLTSTRRQRARRHAPCCKEHSDDERQQRQVTTLTLTCCRGVQLCKHDITKTSCSRSLIGQEACYLRRLHILRRYLIRRYIRRYVVRRYLVNITIHGLINTFVNITFVPS